uniref:Uncharacterized protein n=1 Tax=Arcella intermedia TaxID=1963864 RepID=A0A6B2LNE1_9EUKA
MIEEFNVAQNKRPIIYARFQKGIEDLLSSGDLMSYSALVKEVMVEFQNVSKSIIEIKQAFLQNSVTQELAQLIQQLQTLEKQKLELTCAIHNMRKQNQENEDNYTQFESAIYERNLLDKRRQLSQNLNEITEILLQIRETQDDLQHPSQ